MAEMNEMINVDFQNCFIFILLCLLSLFSYSIFFKKPKNSKQISSNSDYNLPPSPPSLPIIGHFHLLLSTLIHKSLQKLSSKYGPILYIRIFKFPILLISSASVTHEIFKNHDVNISSRIDTSNNDSIIFGSSSFITAPYGDYWKFMNKLVVTKMLGTKAIEKSRDIRGDEVKRFYKSILDKAKKKEKVEIEKEAMKLTNNITCRMSMGSCCSEENGEAEKVRSLVAESFLLLKKILVLSLLRRLLEKPKITLFKKDITSVSNRFDELLERFLKEHEEKPEEHEDMMSVLLTAYQDKNAEFNITRNHIKTFFVELFLGGTDTSSQTIQWIMAELINKPNILLKLREEIDSIVGKTRLIQETDLPNLPYLQAVVKEGLRLHPPAPVLVRTFKERCKIRDFYVPEKTTLVLNIYAMMRDSESWNQDSNEFKPERFLVDSSKLDRDQVLKYFLFGIGRRSCSGSNLGYIMVGIAVGTMVQCFDWKIEGDKKVNMDETNVAMTITMANPINCIPVSRINPEIFNL